MGSVHYVLFRNLDTGKIDNIYAGKVVQASFILNKNSIKRMQNLEREIEILQIADIETSVTLIEIFREEDQTILIQDFANGGSLNNLLDIRKAALPEAEV